MNCRIVCTPKFYPFCIGSSFTFSHQKYLHLRAFNRQRNFVIAHTHTHARSLKHSGKHALLHTVALARAHIDCTCQRCQDEETERHINALIHSRTHARAHAHTKACFQVSDRYCKHTHWQISVTLRISSEMTRICVLCGVTYERKIHSFHDSKRSHSSSCAGKSVGFKVLPVMHDWIVTRQKKIPKGGCSLPAVQLPV